MADHEKVYRVDFDPSKAIKKMQQFEGMLSKFEARLSKLFMEGPASKSVDAFAKKMESIGRKIEKSLNSPAIKRAGLEAIRATKQRASEEAKAERAAIAGERERSRAIKRAGLEAIRAVQQRAREEAKVQREADKVARSAQRAAAQLERMNRTRGEREKARALRAVENRIRRVGSASLFATTSVTGLIAKIALLVGVAHKIREVVTDWMDFDRVMITAAAKFSRLEPDMAPGTKAFKDLRMEMRQAAKDTGETAVGVARAVDFWAKAGKSSEITRKSIPATLDFAKANTDAEGAVLDVARAGDILSDVLGQFKLNSTDAETHMKNLSRVSDVMSSAANKANFSADELFESFKGAGPVLTSIGSDIEETSSLLAVMANAGIKGAIAGTQLKMSIANLSAPTGQQAEMLEKLGVKVADADGNFRGLTSIIRDLNDATKNMGTADRFAVFAKVVGRRAIPSFINLLAEGQTKIDAMTESLRHSGGEAKRLADIIRSAASEQMKRFWERVEDLGFKIIEDTHLFDRMGKALDGIDWDGASAFVEKKIIPALETLGRIISNVIWPGFKRAADLLEQIFVPALWLVDAAFGSVAESGDGLAEVVGVLIAAWVSYRAILVATKAIDIAMFFAQIITGASGATAATAGLSTATMGLNTSIGVAATSATGLVSILGSIAAGGLIGWTVGSIIYKELVEPLEKAWSISKRLKEEYRSSRENENSPNRTKGVLENDLSIAKKKLSSQESGYKFTADELEAFKGKRPEDFTPEQKMKLVKDKSKNIRFEAFQQFSEQQDTRDYIKRTENRIAVKNTEANVQKYDQSQNPDAYQSIPQSGAVTDYEEDFSPGSFQMPEPMRIPIIAQPEPMTVDPNDLINWSGDEMSVPIAYPDPEIFKTGRSVLPEEQFSLPTSTQDPMADQFAEYMKQQGISAEETRDFQKQLLAGSLLAGNNTGGGSKTVQQNITIGGAHVEIKVEGGNPAEMDRRMRQLIKEGNDELTQSFADAADSAEETEW